VERLKLLAHDFSSESQHILVIDGLDEIFVRGEQRKCNAWPKPDALKDLLFLYTKND